MRRAAAALGIAVVIVMAWLATLGAIPAPRSPDGTSAVPPSRRGDAPRRVRVGTCEPAEAVEEVAADVEVDEVANAEPADGSEAVEQVAQVEQPADDDPVAETEARQEPPKPPQRVIRIVDGDGVPIPGVPVGWP